MIKYSLRLLSLEAASRALHKANRRLGRITSSQLSFEADLLQRPIDHIISILYVLNIQLALLVRLGSASLLVDDSEEALTIVPRLRLKQSMLYRCHD